MVPTEEQIDEMLRLVVKRFYELKYQPLPIKSWMTSSMLPLHNCTPLQYVYLALGQIVLNHIDDLKEKMSP